ncbi:MAG: ATP-dependent Clp protease ATP-binding subunit [Myxococcota bacterium]
MAGVTLRLDAYDPAARRAIAGAQGLADERRHPEVEPIHLLYRLVEQDGVVQAALERTGVSPEDVLVEAEIALRRLPRTRGGPAYLSPRTLDLLGRAEGEAAREGGRPVDVSHLLLACAQDTAGAPGRVLRACGLGAPLLRGALGDAAGDVAAGSHRTGGQSGTDSSPLERFGRDLTRLASQGRFDPLVGRDAELRRILQVLARRRANNPMLVGEPGIGKTAIVHGLAARMARGDVPRLLEGRRLVALDRGALVAGAKLRGELEERVRAVLQAMRDAGGEVLLFLPDLDPFIGERASTPAAELMAGALGRGELRALAVATPDTARRAQGSDGAFGRRFVPIPVEPPTTEQAVAILRGVVGRFEIDHGVRIGDPALVSAVQLARRYVPSVQLPKSALDLVDEAAARVRVEMQGVPAELDALERRLETLELQQRSLADDRDPESERTRAQLVEQARSLGPRAEKMRARWDRELELVSERRRLQEELQAARRELEQARSQGADGQARANELKLDTVPPLEAELDRVERALREHGEPMVHDTVRPEDVADVVAAWTGVPVSRMMEGEAERLLRMEQRLAERVVGQAPAVSAVSRAVRRSRVGLRDPRRPIGSFLFLGPSGVGKTELAKALAALLFDDEAALTRLDMSEFMEKHAVARLLGAPPGYVDSEEGGYLTEALRRRPYSVVLFDEMEKAHPDVFNILLQVLDDGRLTDARGRVAHFADAVIIMTSNVGSERILGHQGSADALREAILDELAGHFRPEFLNRIDDVVVFDALTREDLRGIVDIQLRHLAALLAPKDLGLEVSDAAKERLVELGYEPAYGARPLKRVILRELQDPLAERLLRDAFPAGSMVRVDLRDGAFTFQAHRG